MQKQMQDFFGPCIFTTQNEKLKAKNYKLFGLKVYWMKEAYFKKSQLTQF